MFLPGASLRRWISATGSPLITVVTLEHAQRVEAADAVADQHGAGWT
jgi:hypothetical protein